MIIAYQPCDDWDSIIVFAHVGNIMQYPNFASCIPYDSWFPSISPNLLWSSVYTDPWGEESEDELPLSRLIEQKAPVSKVLDPERKKPHVGGRDVAVEVKFNV